MSTIVTRAGKGSALTWTEGDANITNLNNDKLEAGPAANAALNGFTTTATAAGTTILTNTSSVYQLFTGTATQTVRLPSTDTLTTGWSFHIVNNSTVTVLIQTAVLAGLILILPGTTVMATCISTADNSNASWEAGLTDFSTYTGSGAVVLGTSPTITTPTITTPTINGGSIGATTRGTGAFTTLTADTITLDDIRETIFSLGGSGTLTLTPNAANGSIQTLIATGNFTLSAFASPVTGQTITLIITQDATGSRTLTSTMKFAGGSKTLSTAANSIDILTVSYIGTTYYASLVKGYV